MRVTTLHKETNLVDIADRLFANLTPETRQIAEAALLKLNPELAKAEALRPGAIIQVPEVPALKLKSTGTEDDPVGQTREMLKKALNSYHGLLAERLKTEQKELTTQSELLRKLRQQTHLSPEVGPIIEDLERTLKTRIDENEAKAGVLPRALDRALKELE